MERTASQTKQIQQELDRIAINNVLIGYATAIDTKDWELFRSVFTDDCLVEYIREMARADEPGGTLTYRGVEEVTNAMEQFHEGLDGSLHRMSNLAFLAYDGSTARTRLYVDVLLVRRAAPGGGLYHNAGFYEDELVAGGDGSWRILRRLYKSIWADGNAESLVEAVLTDMPG